MRILLFLLVFTPLVHAKNPALKNFREINSSLGTSTNLTGDPGPQKVFELFKEMLPKTGKVSEYSTPMQMALFQLAGTYCERRITLDKALAPEKRWVHREIDFSKAPKNLSRREIESVLEEYSDIFFQRSLTAEEKAILLEGFDAMVAATPIETGQTEVVLTLLCTAFASATDFITI